MGVLNVTPDSFSDGGLHRPPERALQRVRDLLAAGADIIDVGGESTRPGAQPVGEQEELDRVLPVIERIVRETPCLVSVDSRKAIVMDAACSAGACLINDVGALQAPGALEVAVRQRAAVCLMHMQGEPNSMQAAPQYEDVTDEVAEFLLGRALQCLEAGIAKDAIVLDPGFGFGKTLEHNLRLLARLDRIGALGYPVLVGLSRKSMIGRLTGAPVEGRLAGSLAAALLAVGKGARIVRTHDVQETRHALNIIKAVRQAEQHKT